MAARDAWLLAACFLTMGAVVLGAAAACMVERAQPVVVEAPYSMVLPVTDKGMGSMAVVTTESEVDDG